MNIEAYFMARQNGKTSRLIERFLMDVENSIIIVHNNNMKIDLIDRINSYYGINKDILKNKIAFINRPDYFQGVNRDETTFLIDEYLLFKNKHYLEGYFPAFLNLKNIIIYTSFDKLYRVVDNKPTKYCLSDDLMREIKEIDKDKFLQFTDPILSHPDANAKMIVIPNYFDEKRKNKMKANMNGNSYTVEVLNNIFDYDNEMVINTYLNNINNERKYKLH